MKVAYNNSITFRVLQRIEASPGNVVLRADIADLASQRQISRAFNQLVKQGRLVKLGYGVYAKLARSKLVDASYLKGGFIPVAREALDKLNVKWEPSPEEQAYQAGQSTQVPVNPATKLKSRFRRRLRYRNMELKVG